jgi:hypothetical protein
MVCRFMVSTSNHHCFPLGSISSTVIDAPFQPTEWLVGARLQWSARFCGYCVVGLNAASIVLYERARITSVAMNPPKMIHVAFSRLGYSFARVA